MRVLAVTNMYPTKTAPGEGSFVREQVESLRALGLSVDVFAIEGPRGGKKYLLAPAALRRVLAEDRFDLIHAHYGLSGVVALAQRGVPVVTTFHGSDTGFVRWQRHVSWAVARLTTPVFVTVEGAARLGITDPIVIPCGVDTERFRPIDRAEARRRLGWDERSTYILLPGSRRDPAKGAALFDAVLAWLAQELASPVGISLEHLPRDQVALIMNAVDVTLLTSLSEGSPVAVKESLACCTPVVSVAVGDVPKLIEALPGCAIAAREPEALGRAVLGALGLPREGKLRERAEVYAADRIARQIAAVFERAVSGRRR